MSAPVRPDSPVLPPVAPEAPVAPKEPVRKGEGRASEVKARSLEIWNTTKTKVAAFVNVAVKVIGVAALAVFGVLSAGAAAAGVFVKAAPAYAGKAANYTVARLFAWNLPTAAAQVGRFSAFAFANPVNLAVGGVLGLAAVAVTVHLLRAANNAPVRA